MKHSTPSFRVSLSWLLLSLGFLFPPLRGSELALLVGEESAPALAAAEAIQGLPDLKVTRLDLFKGVTQVDGAVDRLKRFPFDGVVALGDAAHSLFRSHRFDRSYAAALVTPTQDDAVVPFDADPEQWVEVFTQLLPGVRELVAVCPSEEERHELTPLAEALERAGKRLRIELPDLEESLDDTFSRIIPSAPAFFLQRSKKLMTRKILLGVLKVSHANKVPLFGFSDALVKAGALASLQVSPESIGVRAAEEALGRELSPLDATLSVNEKRAIYLGISIPGDLLKRFR